MRIYLLDINVLVALHDQQHVHHEVSHSWFQEVGQHGWATCPLTENGFVRILSQPQYPNNVVTPAEALTYLQDMLDAYSHTHHFWADSISLTDKTIFRPEFIAGHKQITDIYLLGLCQLNGGTFVTCDSTVRTDAIFHPHRDLLQILA